jgi:hypothetical protein
MVVTMIMHGITVDHLLITQDHVVDHQSIINPHATVGRALTCDNEDHARNALTCGFS